MAASTNNTDSITTMAATNVTTPSMLEDSSTDRRSVAEIVILSILVAVILLLSFCGNLLVVICIRWNRRLRAETGNIFLVNLSITDMTSAVIVMTATLLSLTMDDWLLTIFWCNMVCIMNYVLIIVSMLTLCFIALDRYAAVVHALMYQTMVTKRKVLALISYAWFQGLVFGITPALLGWIHYDYWEMVCAINWGRDSHGTVIYVLAAFTFCFVIPGAILVSCYCKIMGVAKGISPAMESQKPTGVFVQPAEFNDIRGTINAKTSDTNVTDNDKEIKSSDEETEGEMEEQMAKRNGEEMVVKEQHHVSIVESVSVLSTNSVSNSQKPEEMTAGSQRSIDGDPLQSDPSQAKSPGLTLCTKICPIRCFGSAENPGDLSPNSTEKKGSIILTKRQTFNARASKSRQYSSSNKAIRSLLLVVVAFFVCMTPFCITKVYKVILQNQEALPGSINVIATIFQFCSSAINPLIYGIFRKDFRHVFKSWLRQVLCRSSTNLNSFESDTFSF